MVGRRIRPAVSMSAVDGGVFDVESFLGRVLCRVDGASERRFRGRALRMHQPRYGGVSDRGLQLQERSGVEPSRAALCGHS